MIKFVFIMGILILLSSCAVSSSEGASGVYLRPAGSCGYTVYVGYTDSQADTQLSRCLTLTDASQLADKINKDMSGNWAWAPTK